MAPLENTSQLDISPILEPLENIWSFLFDWTSNTTTPFGVTELFTCIIGTLLLIAFLYYSIKTTFYCLACKNLSINVEKITQSNNIIDTDEKISKQKSILKSINPYFLDSLTEYNGKLYSNQDVETFFSSKTLAHGILHSKIFPLIPILLTGLGVLGTFLGLQLGLSGLELDGDTDKLQHGIRVVAEGAAVAFATSVYGVLSSLVFNSFEKACSAICLRKIHTLQATLEQLFPPFPVMNVFTAIEQYNEKSAECLGGLAEQIGLAMQQSLAPAIESLSNAATDLGNRQATSAEGALSALIKEFSAGMRKEGEEQRKAMSAISEKIETTFANFNDTMQGLANNMGTLNGNLQEVLQEQRGIMDDWQQVTSQYTSVTERLQNTSSNFTNASHELTTFSGSIHNTMERTADSVDNAMNVVQGVSENYEKATESLANTTQAFDKLQGILKETATHLANSVTVAQTDMSEIVKTFTKAIEEKGHGQRGAMEKASAGLQASLENLSTSIKTIAKDQEKTTVKLGEIISKNLEATESLVKQGKTLLEDTKGVHENFSDIASTMQKTSNNFNEASDKLNTFGITIDKTMESTASSIDNAMDIVQTSSKDYSTVSSQFKETNNSLEKVTTSLESVSSTVATSLLEAQKAFSLLFERNMELEWDLRNYTVEIKKLTENQIKALDDHMTNLLANYGNAVNGQVKDRMNAWNEQTKQYTENMIVVVQIMGELVESVDQRPNQKR